MSAWYSDAQSFIPRHIGPSDSDIMAMLKTLSAESLDALIERVVPDDLRTRRELDVPGAQSEASILDSLRESAAKNELWKNYIGTGYYGTLTPPVIQRNILENPGWYTQYTPYQAEIAQGRLEALLNFQTMVSDLCALPVSNASLLDEGTAAAEAMALCRGSAASDLKEFFVAQTCHPQTIAVIKTRAGALGLTVHVGDPQTFDYASTPLFGALLQYPDTLGGVEDWSETIAKLHAQNAMVVVATDLLALTLLKAPGEMGADIAIGSAQRFGVPLGYGGPHAAFLATTEKYTRKIPGRVVGVSQDAMGRPALRLAMQTREQHIRRERATSNICTAQVLLAIMAGMYGVYHGPKGLRRIARRVHGFAKVLGEALIELGLSVHTEHFFDTLVVTVPDDSGFRQRLHAAKTNLRDLGGGRFGVSFDETTTVRDLSELLSLFGARGDLGKRLGAVEFDFKGLARDSEFMQHPTFLAYHSEHEMLRYLHRLEQKDLSLNQSMIPLGSCTMKLNAAAEMLPLSWPEIANLHPFVPPEQARGYFEIFDELEAMIADITGFDAVSLQPNAGSQGEFAGLLAISNYFKANGDARRDVCVIPSSAHGTNPASAVMAGMKVVVVKCDAEGNIDRADLHLKLEKHRDTLAALMVTYPSTHGVFEATIKEVCAAVHDAGGLVYMDGANLNAQVGLCRPQELGADVCHLNLHKTFAIPHGGGGPGVGPIGVVAKLAPYLPGHPVVSPKNGGDLGPVSAAPYGSSSILTISWSYMRLMGREGLRRASEVAILNANYMAKRLEAHYPILYRAENGTVAHEFILDMRGFKASCGVTVDDIAKRLIDFGFHAPTMSWPVASTMMVEPTESETRAELDRFCEAMIAIRQEIRAIESGELPKDDNPLKNAPHTVDMIAADSWEHAYSRQQAAFPLPYVRARKFWPSVARVDNVYGDRNFMCSCPPLESYVNDESAA